MNLRSTLLTKIFSTRAFALLCVLPALLIAFPSQGAEFYGQGSLAISQPDASGDADLTTTTSPRLLGGIQLTPHLSLEAGYYYLYTEQKEEERDTVGSYDVSITSRDFLLGARAKFPLNRLISLYLRGGALLWNTELALEEDFGGDPEGGEDSADDDGIGTYISGGVMFHLTKQLYLDAYLANHQRTDVFKEDSDRPIDITETLGGVAIGFHF